jgi:G3E family GTPase
MNKLDAAPPELVAEFQTWANALFPPKLLVAGTTHGRLDPGWLDLTASDERVPLYPHAHARSLPSPVAGAGGDSANRAGGRVAPGEPAAPDPAAERGRPLPHGERARAPTRYLTPAGAQPACGWIFDAADAFDEGQLVALLAGTPGVVRLKGVFRVADEWIAVNRAGTAVNVSPTAYRRDSRLEVFAAGLDWDRFEDALVGCRLR